MTPFIIFVLALTFVYAIYYAVVITLDLHGKKGDQQNSEEGFEMPKDEPVEEAPQIITEQTKEGEDGGMTYTEQIEEDGTRVVNPTGNKPSHESQLEPPPSMSSEELNEELEADMEEIDPEAQFSLYPDELMDDINRKYDERSNKKNNVIDRI